MCYFGMGDTFTPAHKDLCASVGHVSAPSLLSSHILRLTMVFEEPYVLHGKRWLLVLVYD